MRQLYRALEDFYHDCSANDFKTQRKNVMHNKVKLDSNLNMVGVNMCCMGIVRPYTKSHYVMSRILKTPHGRKLAKILCTAVRKKFPSFNFNRIQVNRNFPGNYHVDKNNKGPSVGLFLGEPGLKGGDLYVFNRKKNRGKVHGVMKKKWLVFDGNDPHMTTPFKGTRYSVIFFQHSSPNVRILRSAKQKLKKMGFPLRINKHFTTKETGLSSKKSMQLGLKFMSKHFPRLHKHYSKINKGGPVRVHRSVTAAHLSKWNKKR